MIDIIFGSGVKEAFLYVLFLFLCYAKLNLYFMFLLFYGVSHMLSVVNNMIDDVLCSNGTMSFTPICMNNITKIPLNFTFLDIGYDLFF